MLRSLFWIRLDVGNIRLSRQAGAPLTSTPADLNILSMRQSSFIFSSAVSHLRLPVSQRCEAAQLWDADW